jgi:eukaryotic-like serine/threonine-protein kinase
LSAVTGTSATEGGQTLYEFGPYRVDPEQRLLLRDNQPVLLQPKAFDTLLVLIRNSENLVLKDDLMKALWPDSFVEESNLSQNIFVLRKAFGETAQDTRYITTVPGRGYRFAAKVRSIPRQGEIVVQTESVTRVLINQTTRETAWRQVAMIVVAVAIALALTLGWKYFRRGRSTALTEKDTVVLADFANSTGDTVFDGTLRQALSAQLDQSPFLNLLSEQRTTQTLALMGQAKDVRLTHEVAREVCQRTASTAVLDGSIAQIGSRYLLTLRALNCSSGEPLASAEAEASDKNHVLDALGKVASVTRSKLGESLASVQKYDVPPQDVTTSSLEALQSYSLAMKVRHGEFTIPSQLFQRAIDQDPNFAMAYAQLGVIDVNVGETVRGADNIRRAYALRDRVSEREKFYIEGHYHDMVTGDLEAARKVYELWEQIYPRDPAPPANLAIVFFYSGDFDKVLNLTQKAIELGGGGGKPSPNLVWCYIFANRLDEAKAMDLDAQKRNLDDPLFHLSLYVIDFLKSDAAAMEKEAAGLTNDPTWGNAMVSQESDTAAYIGQFAKARELTRRASAAAQKADRKQTAAHYEVKSAIREALAGNDELAKSQAKIALKLSNDRDGEAMAALALSLAGDPVTATGLANDLAKRFPEDTVVQTNYLPTVRAATQLRAGNPAQATQTLALAEPYELGVTALDDGSSLYPVYVRAKALLAAKQGAAAAVEFQKILDHPGVVQDEPIGSLARLGLAQAYVLAKDTSKGRAAYQDFLNLWKDGDQDVPLLKQAKAEYARLSSSPKSN